MRWDRNTVTRMSSAELYRQFCHRFFSSQNFPFPAALEQLAEEDLGYAEVLALSRLMRPRMCDGDRGWLYRLQGSCILVEIAVFHRPIDFWDLAYRLSDKDGEIRTEYLDGFCLRRDPMAVS